LGSTFREGRAARLGEQRDWACSRSAIIARADLATPPHLRIP
jgi:hypothetical protein